MDDFFNSLKNQAKTTWKQAAPTMDSVKKQMGSAMDSVSDTLHSCKTAIADMWTRTTSGIKTGQQRLEEEQKAREARRAEHFAQELIKLNMPNHPAVKAVEAAAEAAAAQQAAAVPVPSAEQEACPPAVSPTIQNEQMPTDGVSPAEAAATTEQPSSDGLCAGQDAAHPADSAEATVSELPAVKPVADDTKNPSVQDHGNEPKAENPSLPGETPTEEAAPALNIETTSVPSAEPAMEPVTASAEGPAAENPSVENSDSLAIGKQ